MMYFIFINNVIPIHKKKEYRGSAGLSNKINLINSDGAVFEIDYGSGIQHCPAESIPYGTPLKVVDLGATHVPKDVFEIYSQEICPRYLAETYSLLTHNCKQLQQ
ncbi:hypothetical protein RYX36_010968 [Vicia faba]